MINDEERLPGRFGKEFGKKFAEYLKNVDNKKFLGIYSYKTRKGKSSEKSSEKKYGFVMDN